MNLLQSGLAMQAMQVKAKKVAVLPTEKTIEHFAAQGKALVHKPSNLEALRAEKEAKKAREAQRQMMAHTSPEAA